MTSTTRDSSHIQFCIGHDRVDLEQLQHLFKVAAFWARERKSEDWKIAIANSEPVVTVWDGETAVYRPTVHYVYCPCDSAVSSMHEFEMRRYIPQERLQIAGIALEERGNNAPDEDGIRLNHLRRIRCGDR